MPDALIDADVVVAALAAEHIHHAPSTMLLDAARPKRFAVAAHSYAEAYSTLTRRSPSAPWQWSAEEAWRALSTVASKTALVGLSPAQTLETIRAFSEADGIGLRLYDRLIGEVAVQHGIPRIITWNVGHFRSLFPSLEILTPTETAEP